LCAFAAGEILKIRNPNAVRPWQHVLGPLRGYLMLAQRLYERGIKFSGAWNFGPKHTDAKPVGWIVERVAKARNAPALRDTESPLGMPMDREQ
jgi:CDP-glucose 4,6-dehydratase